MILRVIVLCVCFFHLVSCQSEKGCLTGYMTDVQSWVDRSGKLTSIVDFEHTIDVSTTSNAVPLLQKQLLIHFKHINGSKPSPVKFLSIAKCRLNRVPVIFDMKDSNGRFLADTVEYLTMFGNEFADISVPVDKHDVNINATNAMELVGHRGLGRQSSKPWSAGFQGIIFQKLKELDLRKCSIQILNGNEFLGMPELEALYLGENGIFYMNIDAFAGLKKLLYLDLSRNVYREAGVQKTLNFQSKDVFRGLKQLRSMDLSYTKLSQSNLAAFFSLGKAFQRLSLCKSEILLEENIFNRTSMKILDISGNPSILATKNVLGGLENTLEILYADGVGLTNFEVFANFNKMQILKLSQNYINFIFEQTASSMKKLQILDLDDNKMQTWFSHSFSKMPNLRFLSLRQNNINLLSQNMMHDMQNIAYLGLSGNLMVCNCHSRELYNIALKNQQRPQPLNLRNNKRKYSFHTAFDDYLDLIGSRIIMENNCDDINGNCAEEMNIDGNYILFDYDDESYQCLYEREGQVTEIYKMTTCSQMQRHLEYEDVIHQGWNKIVILICVAVIVLPMLIFVFVYRRNLRYFCITMKNSAMLTLIKNEDSNDNTIFNYDVFVSYCNEDRSWVLDHLLPHVERDCNISVCLHERDFQVGLSILENIVSCMDRSRSIMLIISQRFLLSQWCQFEMHLAQHRLLETRREDLILILLENIPRRMRPNTLHYLMVTKTYIVWPKEEADRPQFWRRLTRSAVTPTLRQRENVSQA